MTDLNPTRRNGQRKAIDAELADALARGMTAVDAAARIGVSESTVKRRLRCPEFQKLLDAARASAVQSVGDQLRGLSEAACGALSEVLADGGDTAKVQAAKTVFDALLKVRESIELQDRLAELESRLTGRESE